VSDIMQSNGSTSMGSVCGSTLSLMAAGVPIKAPVAGIAMGLVYDEGKYVTLTDILGAEDAFGDMDFKVAGTSDAVTALQLDTKIDGLPADVLSKALHQAKDARLAILKVITDTIAEPRSHVAEVAPKIVSIEIPIDKIGEVIGPKGKVINTLQQETGADIAVDDDGVVGTVTIGAKDGRAVEEARRRIAMILDPPTPEVGATYQGRVVNLAKFGAFISIMPGRDGLLHISKLSPLNDGKRIGQVEDVLELGQALEVKVDDIDPQGKVSLSLAGEYANASGDDADATSPRAPREGGSRDRDRAPRDRAPRDSDRAPRDNDRAPRDSDRTPRDNAGSARPAPSSSFEAAFEAELADEIGDLGPGGPSFSEGDGGGRRSPRPRRR
jgi:polyribonucleotide nucleotidyltransferase